MEPQIDAAHFHRRLAETIAWCDHRLARSIAEHGERAWRNDFHPEVLVPADLPGCLRSPELRPRFDSRPNSWGLPHDDERRSEIVEALAKKRGDLLRVRDIAVENPIGMLGGGELLVYEPGGTLSDGGSAGGSDGYFDGKDSSDDVPPWDSWVLFVPGTRSISSFLLAYVPRSLFGLADEGIYCNTGGCLLWLDDLEEIHDKRRFHNTEVLTHLGSLIFC